MLLVPVKEGAVAFKTNHVEIIFSNFKIQFTVYMGSIYFMFKPLVCTKQLRAASPSAASMPGELINMKLFT